MIQILLGFVFSRVGFPFSPVLIATHMAMGITGLALVAFLLGRAYYSSSNVNRFLYVLTFGFAVAQVALGFRILVSADVQLLMGHQRLAFWSFSRSQRW